MQFAERMNRFRSRMDAAGIDVALISHEDNIYYLPGYYDYLYMEFGRPTILVVQRDGKSLLITSTVDLNTAVANARVDRVSACNDGMGAEWSAELSDVLQGAARVGIELDHMPPLVRAFIGSQGQKGRIETVTPLLADMRMIKTPEELQLARHAEQVANAMMAAGRAAIGDGVPEYEVALAASRAETRKAAGLLEACYDDADMSPNTHFLQIMASGDTITKTHHRASTGVMRQG